VELELPLHVNQIPIFESKAKIKTVCCGRRFGKTVLAGNVVVTTAFTKADSMSWVVSPMYSQTMIMWRKINKIIPKQYIKDSSKGDLWIELSNGSMVFAKSADNPDSLVGEGLDLCVVDEAARVKPEAWEVSLQPTLMDSDGDALLLSTPKGKNWFYKECLKGGNPEFPEYEHFHYTSYDNPFLKRSVIERKKKTMSWLYYRQEILAEFVDDGGEVFTGLDQCIMPVFGHAIPIPGREYVMGVDLAKYEDYTVIYVVDTETREVVDWRRPPHMDWAPQKEVIKFMHHKWNDAPMLIDATGVGDPVVEDLEKECVDVVPYKFSGNTLKKQVIEGLVIAFQNKDIHIPNEKTLLEELGAYEYEKLPSGLFRYGAPSGFHDDCVTALALAVWGLEKEYGSRIVGATASLFDEPTTQIELGSNRRLMLLGAVMDENYYTEYDEGDTRLVDYSEKETVITSERHI
jgi:hypothetical protein